MKMTTKMTTTEEPQLQQPRTETHEQRESRGRVTACILRSKTWNENRVVEKEMSPWNGSFFVVCRRLLCVYYQSSNENIVPQLTYSIHFKMSISRDARESLLHSSFLFEQWRKFLMKLFIPKNNYFLRFWDIEDKEIPFFALSCAKRYILIVFDRTPFVTSSFAGIQKRFSFDTKSRF